MESILSNEKILLKKVHHERLQDTSGAIVASNKLSLLQNFVRSFIKRRRRRRKKRNKRIYHILRSYADKCYISEKFSIWKYCLSQVRRKEEKHIKYMIHLSKEKIIYFFQ